MIEAKRGRKGAWLRFVLAMLVSVAIVLALCWKTQTKLQDVLTKLLEADPFMLGMAFVVSALVHILLGAYKWFLILRWSGCRTTYVETLFVRMGSDPLRAVMPFKSGELGNMAYFWRTGRLTLGESMSWVAFDKALNIGGTFFWLVLGLSILAVQQVPDALRSQTRIVLLGSALVTVSVLGFGVFVVSKRVRDLALRIAGKISGKLRKIAEKILSTFEKISPGRKGMLAVLGVVFQFRPILVCILLFQAFADDFQRQPTPAEFLASGSVVVAFSNVPVAQWGTGPREFALNLLFRPYLKSDVATETTEPPKVLGVEAKNTVYHRPVPGAQTLIAIGLLMAVTIHFVPAFFGLPFLVQFLNALRVGKAPPLDGAGDVVDADDGESGST